MSANEREAIRYELLKLKDERGVYVINELGVNTPQSLHALIDYIIANQTTPKEDK